MCEISDFFGDMEGHPASISQMCCTAGILYALGVTDLVCMYPIPLKPYGEPQQTASAPKPPFSDEEYRLYTDCVTRLRTQFLKGTRAASVAVLHPLRTIWAHFVPSHRSMYEPHPEAIVQSVNEAFLTLCRTLLTRGIDFDVLDETSVMHARVEKGAMRIGKQTYRAMVLPPMDTAYCRTMEVLDRFSEAGGIVLAHSLFPTYAADSPREDGRIATLSKKITGRNAVVSSAADVAEQLVSRLLTSSALVPDSSHVLRTRLSTGTTVTYLLVNVSPRRYEGVGKFAAKGGATVLDPVTGRSSAIPVEDLGRGNVSVHLALAPYGSLFISFH